MAELIGTFEGEAVFAAINLQFLADAILGYCGAGIKEAFDMGLDHDEVIASIAKSVPSTSGLWLWEGSSKFTKSSSNFKGKWRPATLADFARFGLATPEGGAA